ncbi:hypothetical protein NEOC65_000591 [Neochlamydia sp. AcF65]|nr:hypothetical protein [Neochlamydia sp. AcF65]
MRLAIYVYILHSITHAKQLFIAFYRACKSDYPYG